MNKHDRLLPMGTEAQIEYLDGDYRIVRHGSFVRCGVTGNPIPVSELRYWSVELQEAYAGPEAVLARIQALRMKSDG